MLIVCDSDQVRYELRTSSFPPGKDSTQYQVFGSSPPRFWISAVLNKKTSSKAGFAIGSLCTCPKFQGKATKYWHIDLRRRIN